MALNTSWLSEENIQKLFIEFPLPLALIEHDGGIEFTNKQFQKRFSPASIVDNCHLEVLIQKQREHAEPLSLKNLDNETVHLLLYTVRLNQFTLLLFDNTPGGTPDDELDKLRKRLTELEYLSSTDSLTGALNRLPLERTADREIKRSTRYQQPISLIFFDIDYFKKINDQYGHNIGDDTLKTLVDIVSVRIRESDTLYRWGGEEFVILATSTDHHSAAKLAENLRQLIAQHHFPHVSKLTISLGVAEFLPGDQLDDWIHRADKALYTAKAKGRNCVITDPFGASDIWYKDKNIAPLQLVWHDHYASGQRTIDEQHRDLFKQANRLINLALEENNGDALLKQLEQVIEFITQHFRDEESILERLNYVKIDEHRQQHKCLLKEANVLKQEVVNGEKPIAHLLDYIAHDVVAKHILIADREYFDIF